MKNMASWSGSSSGRRSPADHPRPTRAVLNVPSRCVADARALQRWSLDERRLPGGLRNPVCQPQLLARTLVADPRGAGGHRRAEPADRDDVRPAPQEPRGRGGVAEAPFGDGAHEPARGIGRDVRVDRPRAQSAARRHLQQRRRGGDTDQGRSSQAGRGGGDPGRHQARRSARQRHHRANPQVPAQVRIRIAGNGSQRGHRRVDEDGGRRSVGQGGRGQDASSSPDCRRSTRIASSFSR